MKLFLLTALAFTLGITAVLGLPAKPQSTPAWYKIGENDLGPIYSTTVSAKRSGVSWYKVGENEHGPIYSSVKPLTVSRRDNQTSSEVMAEYKAWIAEDTQHQKSGSALITRSDSQVEKRDILTQLALCVINCGSALTRANGGADNPRNRVTFCVNRCMIQFGAAEALRDAYLRVYGDQAFPASVTIDL